MGQAESGVQPDRPLEQRLRLPYGLAWDLPEELSAAQEAIVGVELAVLG